MIETTAKACPTCGDDMTQRMRDGKRSGWYCRPCASRRAADRRRTEPEKARDSTLWTYYRIRLADYNKMLADQDGRCAVCRRVPKPRGRVGDSRNGFVIDHDHTCCKGTRDRWGASGHGERICGKCIRGLVCQQCNVALAMVDDDTGRLRALIEYVEAHRGSNPA